jgi:short-subunit dehydrogenase
MNFSTILISGASSGIGAALARVYAAPGIHLVLWGRDGARLQATAEATRARGANVATECFDLADSDALIAALEKADDAGPLDLAVFNAGLGGSLAPEAITQSAAATRAMAAVNFVAPMLGANVIAERMAARKKGRIVLVGSIAAQFPLPMAPVYSGSKAGLSMFAEALALRLKRHGVGVSLVAPGFIDTPMSQGLKEPRPFLISADQAAAIIARRIGRGASRIIVPWQFAVIAQAAKFIPRFLLRWILSAF